MHHANLLVGGVEWAFRLLPEDCRAPSIDVSHLVFERMSIADVHALVSTSHLTAVERPGRVFVIAANSLLHEAQNALLKIFEEPTGKTMFYLIVPREDILLPTLRSRLSLIGTEESEGESNVFSTFIRKSLADRIESISTRLKEDDVSWIPQFMRSAERYAQERGDARLIRDVLFVSTRIGAPGSSKKMLLEHLALSL